VGRRKIYPANAAGDGGYDAEDATHSQTSDAVFAHFPALKVVSRGAFVVTGTPADAQHRLFLICVIC